MKIGIVLAVVLTISSAFSIYKTSAPNYNLTESKEFIKLAAVAFCNDCLKKWTCKTTAEMPMTDVLYVDQSVTKIHGYVGYMPRKNLIVASFRGSNNWQNWAEDVTFPTVAYPNCLGCRIHSGFYGDYLSIEKQVKSHVDELLKKYPTATMLTTGHSLGGAMSVLCALSVKLHLPHLKIQIHNFGQPRVGDPNLSKFITNKVDQIFRVVHNKDIVPHLPPEGLGYHHPPYQIFFNEDLTSYQVCDASGQDKNCSNKFFPNFDPNDHDHYFMYVSHVEC